MNKQAVAQELVKVAELLTADKVSDDLEKRGKDFAKALKRKFGLELALDMHDWQDAEHVILKPKIGDMWLSRDKEHGNFSLSVDPTNFATRKHKNFDQLPTVAQFLGFLKELEASPEHARWLRYIGAMPKGKELDIPALKELARKHLRWFDLDEETPSMVSWSTREHGDVGSETPGSEDMEAAKNFVNESRKTFPTYGIDIQRIGEWVDVTVRES